MSTLEQSLVDRRTIKDGIRSCVVAKDESRTVVVGLWRSEKWILPWSQFVSARFAGDGDNNLELSFVSVRIMVAGENLHGLLEPVAAFRVSALNEFPAQYRLQCGPGEPFISRLEVQPLAAQSDIRETH